MSQPSTGSRRSINRPSHGSRRLGFTLVELLVVIGIIAVLIGILLPSLNKARQAASNVQCLSNMRELGNAMRIYATQYNDSLPIGFMSEYQFSYVVNWRNSASNPPKPSQMGLLGVARLAPNPKAFYCPVETEDQFVYNSPSNLWPKFDTYPVDPNGLFTTPGGGIMTHTRMGYMARPIAEWPANTPIVAGMDPARAAYMPITRLVTDAEAARESFAAGFPKLSSFKGKALISDIFLSRADVVRRHKNSINVLYSNGSAQRQDLGARMLLNASKFQYPSALLYPNWRDWAKDIPSGSVSVSYNKIFLRNQGKPTIAGLWVDLDRMSK